MRTDTLAISGVVISVLTCIFGTLLPVDRETMETVLLIGMGLGIGLVLVAYFQELWKDALLRARNSTDRTDH